MTVRDYSTTASDNATIEGIALNDTMLANALDNAIRQQMADSANFLLDISKPTASTGSANAYTLTTGGTIASYEDKIRIAFAANFSNTGACTINIDTLGVVDLKVYGGGGIADPASGQIQSGGVYDIMYVAAIGDFVVLNPSIAKATTVQMQDGVTDDVYGDSVGVKAAIKALQTDVFQLKQSPTSQPVRSITLVPGVDETIWRFSQVIPATDAADFILLASDDSLSTFETWELRTVTNGSSSLQTTSSPVIASTVGSGTNQYGVSGEIIVRQSSGQWASVNIDIGYFSADPGGSVSHVSGYGVIKTTADLTNLRAKFSSGDIEIGEFIHLTRTYE